MSSYGNLGAACSNVTSDPTRMALADLIARGEMTEGDSCKVGDVVVRRGGEHDAAIAKGLYYAQRGGLSLHRDGTWAAGLRRPGSPKPTPGTKVGREELTGLFDDLAELLSHLTF